MRAGTVSAPDRPIVPYIEGDGTGRDIWKASRRVLDGAVGKAYGGKRAIAWFEVLAGEKAFKATGQWLPAETLEAIKSHHLALKGPLTTPVGGGIRSLNVAIRQVLDLYACVRPVRYFPGAPSPMKKPQELDVVIFRENTEDVYAGHEWASGSPEARRLIEFVESNFAAKIADMSGIGLKPISPGATRRLMRMAIRYCLRRGRKRITIMHKGNIMKFTEGAFRQWCYDLARSEFPDQTTTEEKAPPGKVAINDRIADITFQQVLLRPSEFDVVVAPNLNGDYLSDACAAVVGGLGLAPGANIGDETAVFEATHGTAPKYADKDVVNPGALILSGAMLLEHIGWPEAAALIIRGLERTIKEGIVTYDLARQMERARQVKTSEFAGALLERMA